MSTTGVHSFCKDGGAHEPAHENKNKSIHHNSSRNNAAIPVSNRIPMLFKLEEAVLASPLSSETDSYVVRIPPKSVVNDAELGIEGIVKTINSGKVTLDATDSNLECSNPKNADISNQSAPLVELVGDGFGGEDIFEIGSGNGGVSAESISLPLPIALDSNYLGPDFSDNLKDFVFSVSDHDNLSKVDPNASFDCVNVDGSSFSTLLGNEDSISDSFQVSFCDDSDLVSRVKSVSSHIKEDPTMTSVVSKRSDGNVFQENELLNFSTLTKLSSLEEKTSMAKNELTQNVFQSYQNANDNLLLTLKPEDKLISTSPLKLPSSLFPSSSIMSSLSNISDISSTLNVVPQFIGVDDAAGNNLARTSVQDLNPSSLQFLDTQKEISSTSDQPSQPTALSNQDINVTTISISNKENNSIKILVHSEEGQNVYVINSADLKDGKTGGKVFLNGNPSFFANAGDLIQTSNTSPGQSVASDSLTFQSNPTSSVSGIFLLPVQPTTESNVEKPSRGKKVMVCNEPGCNKTFKKASKLKVHKMLHTGERPYKCTFPGCLWAFTIPHKLKRHMESHEGRKDFICDFPDCGHKFTTIYNLNTHRKIHSRPHTEACTEEGCDQAFHTKRQLEVHLRAFHGLEERSYKCPKPGCDKVFYSSACMGSHMRVHAQNTSYKCKFPDCDKVFHKLCRLRQHEKLHTGERPYICNYEGCTWAFATASKLKRHQTKHTGVRKWQCHICMKFFMRSEHLKGHLITHSGDRPFVCPVEGCGNAFTAKSSLYVHLRKHDDSGKTIIYNCPMDKCDRHYACKASLRQHIMVKHCTTPKDNTDTQLSQNQGEGVINWLNLLEPNDGSNVASVVGTDPNLAQEQLSHSEGLVQAALTRNQEGTVINADFLTGDIPSQTLLHPVGSAGTGIVIPDPHQQQQTSTIHHPHLPHTHTHTPLPHTQKMVVISSQAVTNLAFTAATASTATSSLLSAPPIALSIPPPSSTLSAPLPPALQLQPPPPLLSSSSSPSSSLESITSVVIPPPPSSVVSTSLDDHLGTQPVLQHAPNQNVIQVPAVLRPPEKMSNDTLERGKKRQFMFDNLQGCARTDDHSNQIISERALKRWKKQKELEAAKLGANLEPHTSALSPTSASLSSSPSLSSPSTSATIGATTTIAQPLQLPLPLAQPIPGMTVVPVADLVANLDNPTTNISISGHPPNAIHLAAATDVVEGNNSTMIFKQEIPDLELQAEGLHGSVVLEGGRSATGHGDSFMTELFIKDPETGMTYRQTQLLQDDPPTLCLLEDMGEVEPSRNVVLDAGLDGNLMEESLPFDDL